MTSPTETTVDTGRARSGTSGRMSAAIVSRSVSPHLVLALAALIAVATEPAVQYGRTHETRAAHVLIALGLLVRAACAGAALLYAWRVQDRLRLGPILLVGVAFQLAWIGTHLALHVKPDQDLGLYRDQGHTLLSGDYPRSEYPTGAVLLFALENWLGDGTNRVPHAFLMVPCQLAIVVAIWSLRTRWSPWLAALVAVWPLNAFHWEFRYDLLPTALLAVGLALALRKHWLGAGLALGAGTAVKWTPALSLLVLVVWLLARGRRRPAGAATLGFALAWGILTLPLLAWRPGEVIAAYTGQGGRGITGESIWYLPLRAVGQARLGGYLSWGAHVPQWANVGVVVLQVVVILVLLALVWRFRSLASVVAVAALTPTVFLLTNRVFSSQFLVTMLVAWAIAAALVVRTRREQLAVGVLATAATCANALVHPYTVPRVWELASVALFALALAVTGWLVFAASSAAGDVRHA
jgi:Glycosyltransferase family 87